MDPALYGVAGLAGLAAWAARRGRRVCESFPVDLSITDPVPSAEGSFVLGRYLPDEGEPCRWSPWDGGEQHLGIFGTTGSGKTVAARLLAVSAAELWGWKVTAIDGAKAGIDFTFLEDAGIGRVVSGADVPGVLVSVAQEIERRGRVLARVRVRRTDAGGTERAIAPGSLRELTTDERVAHGLVPELVIIDELAILLAGERAVKGKRPISDPLLRIAAAGRFAGIHLACLMQRGDSDLLSGFIGNLLRARILVGTTDQVAEQMAHGAGVMRVWEELMAAAGYEPNGMERALRPPGRAFVSGLAPRAPGLVQLHRFDSITRAPTWADWSTRPEPPMPPVSADPPAPTDSPDAAGPGSDAPPDESPSSSPGACDAPDDPRRGSPPAPGSSSAPRRPVLVALPGGRR